MPALGSAFANSLLNWGWTGTTAPTRPAAWGVGLSLGAPSSTSASELALGSGITRQTLQMAVATAGSVSNSAAMTFGPNSASAVFSGLQVWDTSSSTNGLMLNYGTLATVRTLLSGDYLLFPIGAIVGTMG